jgi:catechol 2,3-dioxygenase-like lactoylglutathione lyase family enzyme
VPLAVLAMLTFPGRDQRVALRVRTLLDDCITATSLDPDHLKSRHQHRVEDNVDDALGLHRRPKEGGHMTMPMPAEWSFGATIPAKDLDGTRRFYEDVLGAQVVTEDPGGIIYRSGDSTFSLYPTEYAGTAQHTLGAFMVRDVEATVADLRGKGVTFEDYDLPGLKTVNGIAELGGVRGAWFKDPEGNILSVVQLPAT